MTRELVVISGKGGTGKTSIVASLAVLARTAVLADCDVDAADLHLVLAPKVRELHPFYAGRVASIEPEACTGCGACAQACRFGAVNLEATAGRSTYHVDPVACEGCGVCDWVCPAGAVRLGRRRCGAWMISQSRCGPVVHARLDPAAENSGKLVATVRREARRIAAGDRRPLVIVDGPPGLGCPVIAAVSGANRVLAVTEPTVSGAHDLARVLALAEHFSIPTTVAVNRWDINRAATEQIEAAARAAGASLAGRVRYDPGVTRAQLAERAAVETDTPAAADLRALWRRLSSLLAADRRRTSAADARAEPARRDGTRGAS
jgi:MinD superfamily P-loop ATPase